MLFFWRRARRPFGPRNGLHKGPRDVREDSPIGRYEEAPQRARLLEGVRFSPHDWTTLWGAAALGYSEMVARMLRRGHDIEARDDSGNTALIFASDFGRTGMVRQLLAAGADPNARNFAGQTALFVPPGACAGGIVPLLLDAGANVHARSDNGDLAMHHALRRGDSRLARTLLDLDADLLHARGREGDTPLIAAASGASGTGTTNGAAAAVRLLVERGARVDAVNRHGHSALLLAAMQDDHEGDLPSAAIRCLLHAGAAVGFLEAIALGDAETAEALPTGYGTHLDTLVSGIETPLTWAASWGRDDLADLLLERGARVDGISPYRGTALDAAADARHAPTLRLLLDAGADPESALRYGANPLLRLAGRDPLPTPPAALPPLPDSPTRTVRDLYEAASDPTDAPGRIRWLLLCGADINARDEHGETALMHAARDKNEAAVRALLACGAEN